MEIRVHGPGQAPMPVAVTMRTPGNDFELAVGLCRTEGIIAPDDEIDTIAYCLAPDADDPAGKPVQQYNIVTVRLRRPVASDVREHRYLANVGVRDLRQVGARRGRGSVCAGGRGSTRSRRALFAGCPTAWPRTSRCSTRRAGCTPPRASPRRASSSHSAKTSAGTTRSTSSSATRCSTARCRFPTRCCSCRAGSRSSSCRRPRSRASPCCARCRRRRASRCRPRNASGRRSSASCAAARFNVYAHAERIDLAA